MIAIEHNIVSKPWGYEYIVYQNEYVAMKLLHIRQGERTSLHCHPNKSTGLVVVDGTAEINFIADSRTLTAPAKQMIRRGLFHQTHAVSSGGILMLEIETPVDKDDLVRLKDSYGRKDSGYEGQQFELPKTEECVWFDDPPAQQKNHYSVGSVDITIERMSDVKALENNLDTDILIFLRGGLIKSIDGRQHLVTQPGDVGNVNVIRQVAQEMDGFAPDTIIMTVR
jgi:mannose-6-phosphate isomerase-like protein (cupin superfamily)